MSKSPTWLMEFRSDVFSQTGEDGVIAKILSVVSENDKWCVECGAWDGIHLSNTRNLIERHNYAAVLIEGNQKKFRELQKNCAGNGKVIAINKVVGFSEMDNLDRILGTTSIPIGFDLLSLDVDGNDIHIWKAMSVYRPKVVCIEFNPTIPTEVRFVQPPDPGINQGCSLTALVELAKGKGYELVAVLPWNAFFVRAEYFPQFSLSDNNPAVLRTDLSYITYIFSGYDGRLFLDGYRKLPWHGKELREPRIQHLPRFLQKYPSMYGPLSKLGLFLHSMLFRR